MELHTLGVDGGYTQDDVIAVARAFTGWTIYDVNRIAEFQFNPAFHDRKEKIVLGQTIPAGGGEQDGVQVIDILARHPSTARFISRKLAQRFVADDPPQSLVDRMAATFTATGGDLRAVVETMLTSREFLSEGAWQAKLKSPLEMVLSAVRVLGADVTDPTAACATHRRAGPADVRQSRADRLFDDQRRVVELGRIPRPHQFCGRTRRRPDRGRQSRPGAPAEQWRGCGAAAAGRRGVSRHVEAARERRQGDAVVTGEHCGRRTRVP